MLVWGGQDASGQLGDGAAYDPVADTWTPISAAGAPSPPFSIPAPDGYIAGNSTAWTGSKLLTYGALPSGAGWGGIYDPQTNTWAEMAPAPSQLAGRVPDVVVWTDSSAIIYGGQFNGGYFGDGALFTP
jgi:hypothetical protein